MMSYSVLNRLQATSLELLLANALQRIQLWPRENLRKWREEESRKSGQRSETKMAVYFFGLENFENLS